MIWVKSALKYNEVIGLEFKKIVFKQTPYYTKLEITLLEEIQDARQEGLSETEIIKTLEKIINGLKS